MADDPCIEIINAFEGLVQEHGGDELLLDFRKMDKANKSLIADEIFVKFDKEIRQAKLTVAAWDLIENYLKAEGKTKEALADFFSGGGIRDRGRISLERLGEGILNQFEAQLDEGLEHYKVRKFGLVHSAEGQRNIIYEAYKKGSTSDKDAAQFMKNYGIAHEKLRKLFNNAGGDIADNPVYNFPQFHDAVRINRLIKGKRNEASIIAGRKEYVDFVKDLIDLNNLVWKDGSPMGLKVSPEVQDKILGRVFDNLSSGGVLHKEMAVNPHVRRMLGRHHQEHRLLQFKDADSWMKYADRFGASDYVQSLHAHAEQMSREIAAMQLLGPNADMIVKKMRLEIQKEAGDKNAGALGEAIYDHIMGRPYTNNTRFADGMRMIRNSSIGLKIGKAAISAISDLGFFGITRQYNNLPFFKGYINILKGLTNSKETRMLAAHLVLGARYAIDNAKSAYRISDIMGVGGSARFADFVVKASGLNFWTNTVRQTFGLDYLNYLGSVSKREYKNLHPRTRNIFKKYGVTADDWDRVRQTPLYEKHGAFYLDPNAFEDDGLTFKIVGMINEEMDFAVPEPNAKVMTVLRGGAQPGTWPGEMARGVAMFKSFSTSVVMSHWMRALNQPAVVSIRNPLQSKVGYFMSLFMGTTMLGAMAIQAKQLVDGKTPMDMDDKFWAWAFLQGGGSGLAGDFLFQDHTRVSSVSEFFGGPLASDASTTLGLLLGTPSDFMFARDQIGKKLGKRTGKAVDKLMPNLWQTNLLAKRYFGDHIHMLLNPDWASDQRASRRRMQKERGQKHYWKPGELSP